MVSAKRFVPKGVIPTLLVTDVAASAVWYQRALGFRLSQLVGDPPSFAIVDLLPGVVIHLRRGTPAPNAVRGDGVWDVYVECSELDQLVEALAVRGVAPARGPEVTSYGMREVMVVDPDGYGLCFAEET